MAFIWDDLKVATFETGAKSQVHLKKPGTSGQRSLFLILSLPLWLFQLGLIFGLLFFHPMHKNCYLTAFHPWPTSILASVSVEPSQPLTSCMPLTLKCKPHARSFPQASDPITQGSLRCLLHSLGTSNMSQWNLSHILLLYCLFLLVVSLCPVTQAKALRVIPNPSSPLFNAINWSSIP